MPHNNDAVLNIESTAQLLGTSTATVRNWVKGGYLPTLGKNAKYTFYKKDVENIKSKILNGEWGKLNKRANKTNAGRVFIPDEYIRDKTDAEKLNAIVQYIKNHDIDVFSALLLVGLNLLKKNKIIPAVSTSDIIQKKEPPITNKHIAKEIKSWFSEIKSESINKRVSFLLHCETPRQQDTLGFIYQSLLLEGQKAQRGSYYTPSHIVDEMIAEHVRKDSKILDPCCGTGQFLLAAADVIENPSNIYGIDCDPIAVRIARLNMLIKFKNKNFTPNIVCKNTLFDVGNNDLFRLDTENIKDFDVITTNPPWGVHFSKPDATKLKKLYPTISSSESFSYFLKKSIELLHDDGVISFILPESILNVKTHKDIRSIVLKNTQVKKIMCFGQIFKNVFTPVIRLDLRKNQNQNNKVKIEKRNEKYEVKQARWLNNHDFIFDIHASDFDCEILDKIYQTKHTTLKNQADWALGIVTGNNKKFISSEQKEGFEPIYKGKEVGKFVLDSPSSFIQFTPEKFQQVAPTEKYRAKEKLIYRFISKYLVFAYSDKQQLSLNSANIIIPKLPNYPIKVIAALLNSSLYQFIFQKRFSSIKVLRSHIEKMPLPLWDKKTFSEITKQVDEIIQNKNNFEQLDNYILDKFSLQPKEKNYIQAFNH